MANGGGSPCSQRMADAGGAKPRQAEQLLKTKLADFTIIRGDKRKQLLDCKMKHLLGGGGKPCSVQCAPYGIRPAHIDM